MKHLINYIKNKLSVSFIGLFSAFAVTASRFESRPQDCGMMDMQVRRKNLVERTKK